MTKPKPINVAELDQALAAILEHSIPTIAAVLRGFKAEAGVTDVEALALTIAVMNMPGRQEGQG